METKFQTSFIPKKPLMTEQRTQSGGGISIFLALGVIIFIISLGGVGFVIAWKQVLLNSQNTYKTDLAAAQSRFNTTKIEELKQTNLKIDFAKKLLANHLSVSEIFTIVGGLTIDGVRFLTLNYTGPNIASADATTAKISMRGIANSFSSIAWQSDVFGSSQKYGTNKIIKNPVLSDLSVDANGNVSFGFSGEIVPADISYEKVLTNTLQSEGLLPQTTSSTTSQ